MKQYVIDEIRYQDYEKVKAHLDETYGTSGLDGLYWIPLEEALYSERQQSHGECAPFFMAMELTETRLAGELLVRTRSRVRCDCIQYADQRQRDWMIRTMDAIFEQLEIIT